MRDRKKRNIIIGSLCCLLVFMGIGYALLSQTLNINGTANLTGKWKIYIDSITVKEIGGSAKSNAAEVSEDKLTANFDVELLKPGDYVEYDVVVKNEGTINAVLRELIPNIESNNMDILLTHSIIQGQILKAESETKFTLKIRFDERATEIVEGGKTTFDIKMVYEQYDGDASGIDPSLVPVTANDCFEIDDNGVITDYDYSCGTYVTVPAVVNGTTVTEISSSAFTEGNVELYMSEDGNSGFYVAKTKEVYDVLYAMLVEQGAPVEQLSTMLYMEGDLNIPDTTGMTIQTMNFVNDEFVSPTASLEYLDLSQAGGLTKIQNGAFSSSSDVQSLKYLNLEGVDPSVIEEAAFDYSNLESLTIDIDLFNSFHNKFTATINTLRIYPGESTEIPDREQFYAHHKITVNNLIIEEGITRIGNNAFKVDHYWNAWEAKNIELPESLTEIGSGAFYGNSITNVELPKKLKIIGDSAFSRTKLTAITIPTSVETIGVAAFTENSNLTSLIFEENSRLTYIGSDAFQNNRLTSVDFSPIKHKFEIGNYAFTGNDITDVSLTNVELGANVFKSNPLTSVELIGNIVMNTDKPMNGSTTYGSFSDNTQLESVVIKSDTMETISNYAFTNAPIKTLQLLNENGTSTNSSIKTIGDSAFYTATPTTLVLPTSIESIGNYAFYSMPDTSTITSNKAEGSFTTGNLWNGSAKVIYNS